MNMISIPPIVMATLMFYVGFYHFMIYRHQKDRRENLTFALSCFSVGIYSICCAGLYSATSPTVGVQWQRFQVISLAILGIALLWFIYDYTGKANRKIVIGFTIYYLFAALTGLLYGGDLIWTNEPSIKEISLLFGYDIRYNEMTPGVLTNLQSIVGLIYFIYILKVSLSFYKSGNKQKGIPLLAAVFILFVGLMNDSFVSSGFYASIYILEYSYIGIIFVFTYFLTKIVLRASEIEIALLESEGKFRGLVESSSDWIWEINSMGVYTYASPKIEEMLGYKPEDVIGKTPFDLMSPEDKERNAKIFQNLIGEGKPIVTLENVNLHKNGQRIVLETSGVPVLDAAGNVTGYRGVDRDITERKRMEKTLWESEQKFRTITEQLSDLISLTDNTGVIIYASPSSEQLFAVKPDNMVGRHFMEFLDESSIPLAMQEFQQSVTEGSQTKKLELLMKRDDGSRFYGELTGSVFNFESIQGTLVVIRDITESKKNQEALRESEERYRLIADNATDVIWTRDLNLNLTYISPSIMDQQGYTIEEAMDRTMEETFTHDSLKLTKEVFREELEIERGERRDMGRSRTIEVEVKCKNGSTIFTEIKMSFLRDPDDKATGIIGITRNITERKQAEEKAQAQHERFKTFFSSVNDSIFVHPLQEEGFAPFTDVNDIACERYGYSRDEFLKLTAQDITKQVDANVHSTSNHRKKLLDRKHLVFEAVHIKKSGEEFPVEINSNIVEQFGQPVILAVVRDISERKQAEKEKAQLESHLQQAQKMEAIGTLAGGIAHDFNNILFPLIGYSEMLKQDLPTDSPLQGHVDGILRAALRSKDLVNQILVISRQGDKDIKPIKLQPIIKEATKLLRSSIPTTIEFQQDVDPDCGIVVADPTQIHQIVMNLVTNAYHAMEETGGKLKVNLRQVTLEPDQSFPAEMIPGEYALLSVSDTGIGIEKNIFEKLFDPYFTTKKAGKGTGLGLSVVQGIIQGCNGDIRIYSEPEKGTEVQVYLPIMDQKVDEAHTGQLESIQGGIEKILIVDDEEAIVKMEQQMLERLGYRVTIHTGSIDALEAFKTNPDSFDLVLTDMTMPNMTGDKLAIEIKRIRPGIPVVLCTGFSEKVGEGKSSEFGIDCILMKPIAMIELAKSVRDALDRINRSIQ